MTLHRKKHFTLAEAHKEVAAKSDKTIERETAKKWTARAAACYERAAETTGAARTKWLLRADDYKHEALEHGALVGDRGRTVGKIERELEVLRKKFRK
jgi:hypothetical protein